MPRLAKQSIINLFKLSPYHYSSERRASPLPLSSEYLRRYLKFPDLDPRESKWVSVLVVWLVCPILSCAVLQLVFLLLYTCDRYRLFIPLLSQSCCNVVRALLCRMD